MPKEERKKEAINIRVKPSLKRKIQREARRQRLSMSEFIAQEMAKAV